MPRLPEFVGELLGNAELELRHTPLDQQCPDGPTEFSGSVVASASAEVIDGFTTTLSIGFGLRATYRVASVPDALLALPQAALRAAARFGPITAAGDLSPAIRRACAGSC